MALGPGLKIMTTPGALDGSDTTGVAYPVRIYYASLVAAGTAGSLSLHIGNATAKTSGSFLRLRALANSQSAQSIAHGVLCTSGAYVAFETGSMKVAVVYSRESI